MIQFRDQMGNLKKESEFKIVFSNPEECIDRAIFTDEH
jgi:hypothetical protein